ncbi:MAG: hypothetical protein KGQ94_12450 [Alphaproteobacteria bacterium]|nr:hypothetical protein [Alphaproteobacteria bacterium]
MIFNRIVEKVAIQRQIREVAERPAQFLAPVAIAGNEIERCSQPGENFAQMRIFCGKAVLDAVSGVDHRVDRLPVDIGNALPEIPGAARACRLIGRTCQNMRIADLGYEHKRSAPGPAVLMAAAATMEII